MGEAGKWCVLRIAFGALKKTTNRRSQLETRRQIQLVNRVVVASAAQQRRRRRVHRRPGRDDSSLTGKSGELTGCATQVPARP
jgi:hypothetical protein